MPQKAPAWTVYVAVAGLVFGVWQYARAAKRTSGMLSSARTISAIASCAVERRAEERWAERAIVKQLEQLVNDLRARVADLEKITTYLHGEQRPPSR